MPTKPIGQLESMVGQRRETVTGLRVTRGKIEEFARALRDDDPVYRDAEAAAARGFPAVPAPLTFTRVSAFPRNRPAGVEATGFDLGLEPVVIHGEQGYRYERPLVAGDVLDGETKLADVYQREGRRGGTMTFVEYETAYRDQDGDLVVTERSTAIETEGAIDPDDTDAVTRLDPAEQRDREDRVRYLDVGEGIRSAATHGPPDAATVAAGDAGPELVVEDVQRPDFVKYAGASGDFNPVHYSEPYAHATGNDRVFGQGMLTAGYAAQFVADWFGLARVRAFRTRFESQLWPGDTVTVSGEVKSADRAEGTVEAEFVAENDGGTTLLIGSATADLS